MDYISVVEGSPHMHEKLCLFDGKVRDGHAPFLEEPDLQAYVMAGIPQITSAPHTPMRERAKKRNDGSHP